MALQVAYNVEHYGLDASEAYVKIYRYEGDKDFITIHIAIWISDEARFDNKEPIEFREYSIPYDDQALTDLYIYLKTLPEFDGAIDV